MTTTADLLHALLEAITSDPRVVDFLVRWGPLLQLALLAYTLPLLIVRSALWRPRRAARS